MQEQIYFRYDASRIIWFGISIFFLSKRSWRYGDLYLKVFFWRSRLRYHPQKGLHFYPWCNVRQKSVAALFVFIVFTSKAIKLEGNVLNDRLSYSTSRTQEFCEPIHQRCSILRPLRLYKTSPHTMPTSLDGVALQIVILYGIWSHAPIFTEKKNQAVFPYKWRIHRPARVIPHCHAKVLRIGFCYHESMMAGLNYDHWLFDSTIPWSYGNSPFLTTCSILYFLKISLISTSRISVSINYEPSQPRPRVVPRGLDWIQVTNILLSKSLHE